jgi:hypothetical protein
VAEDDPPPEDEDEPEEPDELPGLDPILPPVPPEDRAAVTVSSPWSDYGTWHDPAAVPPEDQAAVTVSSPWSDQGTWHRWRWREWTGRAPEDCRFNG